MKSKLLVLILCSLIIQACNPKTSDEYLTDAKAFIADGQVDVAILDLKNSIQQNANNNEARFLLGSIYLDEGAYLQAEKEFERLNQESLDPQTFLPKFARLLFLLERENELANLAKQDSIANSTLQIINFYYGWALVRSNNINLALPILKTVVTNTPETEQSKLAQSLISVNDGNLIQAKEVISQLLESTPNSLDGLFLGGVLDLKLNDAASSSKKFAHLVANVPKDRLYKFYLAQALIGEKEYKRAEKYVDHLMRSTPNQPLLNQFKGTIAYSESDFELSSRHFEKAIQNGLSSISNRVLAAISYYNLDKKEQAYRHLISIESELPEAHTGNKLLTLLQLQLGYTEEASNSLKNINNLPINELDLYAIVSDDLFKLGKYSESKELLNKFEGLAPQNAENLNKLGSLKISHGDLDGLKDLEKAVDMGSSDASSKTILALSYLQANEYEKVFELTKQWKLLEPKSVVPLNIEALALVAQKKEDEAEVVFKNALSILPSNPPSLLFLSNKYSQAGNLEKANEMLTKLLKHHPYYPIALERLFSVQSSLGDTTESTQLIKNAFNANPDAIQYKLLYAKLLIVSKKADEVIGLLVGIETNSNTPDLYWLALGDSYSIKNNLVEANAVYNDWLQKKPNNSLAHIRYISSLEKLQQWDQALIATNNALQTFKNSERFKLLKVNFLLHTNQPQEAQKILNSLSENLADSLAFKSLQGQTYLLLEQAEKALPLLVESYLSNPSSRNTMLVSSAQAAAGYQSKEITEFLQTHIKAHPKDINVRRILATRLQPADATIQYKEILNYAPNSTTVNNNLAWTLYKQEKYSEAKPYAEQALRLDENNPVILDTIAMISLKLGAHQKALTHISKAMERNISSIDIILHHIEILIANGEINEATKRLNEIKSGDTRVLSEIDRLNKLLQS